MKAPTISAATRNFFMAYSLPNIGAQGTGKMRRQKGFLAKPRKSPHPKVPARAFFRFFDGSNVAVICPTCQFFGKDHASGPPKPWTSQPRPGAYFTRRP
jgi:hypothetical protein